MKANRKPTHMRVTSIQSVTTTATLEEGGDILECSETENADASPRTKASEILFDYSMRDSTLVTVKNTFVEMDIPRPLAWDGCFEDREVQSAPGSVLVLPRVESDAMSPWDGARSNGEDGDSDEEGDTVCPSGQMFAAHGLMPPPFLEPVFFQTAPISRSVMQRAPISTRPTGVTLRLAEALKPTLGSVLLPTVGSAGHLSRKCKPCAFAWKESGCQSGVSCKFCHLCDPAEKKRRRQAKLEFRRNRSEHKTGIPQ